MLIREWMTTEVISVKIDTSMLKASKLMKEFNIRRLPVTDDHNKVIGILSDRDIKEASPSKATTLDMHELYYLLSQIKVKDIMTPDPTCVNVNDTVEMVALLMEERSMGGLPVVDDNGVLVGIITDHDIFKVFIAITGARHGGVQFAISVDDQPGSMRPVLDLLKDYHARVVTVLTENGEGGENKRTLFLRIKPMERNEENRIVEAIKSKFNLLYWVRDKYHEA